MPQTIGTLPEPTTQLARTSDPVTSHNAAARMLSGRARVKLAVLHLIDEFGDLTGEELNGLYKPRADRREFPAARYDSPRKRAGELARDGFLNADRSDGLETVYTVTDAGREFLAQVSA